MYMIYNDNVGQFRFCEDFKKIISVKNVIYAEMQFLLADARGQKKMGTGLLLCSV